MTYKCPRCHCLCDQFQARLEADDDRTWEMCPRCPNEYLDLLDEKQIMREQCKTNFLQAYINQAIIDGILYGDWQVGRISFRDMFDEAWTAKHSVTSPHLGLLIQNIKP